MYFLVFAISEITSVCAKKNIQQTWAEMEAVTGRLLDKPSELLFKIIKIVGEEFLCISHKTDGNTVCLSEL